MAPGAADHPLAQVDKRVLMPARHGIGQLAQLDGKFVQILAERRVVHPATLDHPDGVVTSRCLLVAYSSFPAWRPAGRRGGAGGPTLNYWRRPLAKIGWPCRDSPGSR